VQLTERDYELLRALTHRVRVFSIAQVARTWWGGSPSSFQTARRRTLQLQEAGFLHAYSALSHPELDIREPALAWSPDSPDPEMGSVAYQLQERWKKPPVMNQFVIATASAGRFLGGHGGRIPREKEQSHDLHLAAVFLHYKANNPEEAIYWRSEALLLQDREDPREKLPDAILELDSGPRIIEFGGSYSRAKLERFHDYWAQRSTPYEIW
jgi:hypothetical protein